MKSKVLIILGMTFLCLKVIAQQSVGTLNGVVTFNNEPAIGATISLTSLKKYEATDLNGEFSISDIPLGNHTLEISYTGAKTIVEEIQILEKDVTFNFELETSSEQIEEVRVTAKSGAREQQDQSIQIGSVEIKAVSGRVKDITEAIERMPGINVRGSGSFGDKADISINGLNGTAVRTYIDGLPLEFVYPSFSINNIPIDNISRVDVYKGVVPIDVGSDALGGGVNIITQQKPYNEFKASYGLGSFNTHQANLSGSYIVTENVVLSSNLSYNYSDNNYKMNAYIWEDQKEGKVERFHDKYKLFFGDIAIDIRNKKWADKFRLSANYSTSYKEVQNGGTVTQFAFGNVNYDGDGLAFSLIYNKSLGEKLHLATTSNYNNNNVIFTDTTANIYSWSGKIITQTPNDRGELGRNSFSDRNFENLVNRTNLTWQISSNDEMLLTNLIAYQNTVGRDEVLPIEADFLTQNQYLTKNISGLQYQRKLFNEKLIAAVAGKLYYYKIEGVERLSRTNIKNEENRLGYYFSAKYNLTNQFFIRGSFESALRVPTFYQFFGNGANIISNVELKAESSDNANLGFSYRNNSKQNFAYGITTNGFLRGQNDLIYLTTDIFQRYQNAEEVKTVGVEGEIYIELWEKLRLQFNLTRLKQTYESINEQNQSAQFLVGTSFPNNPNLFTNARLSYQVKNLFQQKDNFRIYAQHKYVDEFNFINVGVIYDPNNFVPVQHRIDAGFVYSILNDKFAFAFNANNILDAENFDNFSIPRPGRNFNFKLIYKFNDY